jgi:hypothetical protein
VTSMKKTSLTFDWHYTLQSPHFFLRILVLL